MSFIRHIPAYQGLIVSLFDLKPNDLFLDLTLGDGGHTEEVLDAGCRVISVDVDIESINRSVQFLSVKYQPLILRPGMRVDIPSNFKWLVIHANFKDIKRIHSEYQLPKFKGILADLGTSQYQIATAERGFSFNLEGPLDMRLDKSLGVTAADLVNALGESELIDLLTMVDEYQAKSIARAIIRERKSAPITTTTRLSKIVSMAKHQTNSKINPSTKTFMALRMAVNLEREVIAQTLTALPDLLEKEGRLGVISFHSGEDRLVKHFIKKAKQESVLSVVNVKPIKPSENEIQHNPKIRSAKLRLAQKI